MLNADNDRLKQNIEQTLSVRNVVNAQIKQRYRYNKGITKVTKITKAVILPAANAWLGENAELNEYLQVASAPKRRLLAYYTYLTVLGSRTNFLSTFNKEECESS